MNTSQFKNTSPLPSDLESAYTEILRLRQQLYQQNQRLERLFTKLEKTKRSLLGQIKALEKRLGIKVILDRTSNRRGIVFKTTCGHPLEEIIVGVNDEIKSN